MKLTKRQKTVLSVLTNDLQEISQIMSQTGDCYADTRLLQLHKKGLVEEGRVHRPGQKRTWMAYRLTASGQQAKEEVAQPCAD